MLKDYSGSCVYVTGRNRMRVSRKKPGTSSRQIFQTAKLLRKKIGVMLLATLFIGISSTIWYGLQVRVALDQIGDYRAVNSELQNERKLLSAERNLLLTKDHVAAAARKLGLRFPTDNQLRYP